ncbi:hypothetical protein, partial [Mesobacillus selenatarsenatis]|uniref:hypothetical protein n=1 Tax=Mesobacillus selenatarsenatis TaxID=388741 RepID=UPI001E2BC114
LFCSLCKALFSNFVLLNTKWDESPIFFGKVDSSYEKRAFTCKTVIYYVKIGFRILTSNLYENSLM